MSDERICRLCAEPIAVEEDAYDLDAKALMG